MRLDRVASAIAIHWLCLLVKHGCLLGDMMGARMPFPRSSANVTTALAIVKEPVTGDGFSEEEHG